MTTSRRNVRQMKDLTQEQFAAISGFSQQSISPPRRA